MDLRESILILITGITSIGNTRANDFEHTQEAKADLRALHAAAKKYLDANGQVWPQMPDQVRNDERQFGKFWKVTLKPYGAEEKHWRHSGDKGDRAANYLPTLFSKKPGTASKWLTQPWFISVGCPSGMFVILPSGEVTSPLK